MVSLWVPLLVCLALSGLACGQSDIERELRAKVVGSHMKRNGRPFRVAFLEYAPEKVRFNKSVMCSLKLTLQPIQPRSKGFECYLTVLRYHPGDPNIVLQKNCNEAKDQIKALTDACVHESNRLWSV